MPSSSLRDRLTKSRVVQVLVVYLGAAWVVIEVAGGLQEALELPAWVSPVAIILLLVGLLVVLATAWVQSHPQVDAREATGEVPDSWEVGVADLANSLRRGKLPHLTWARTLVGGLFAFWLLFGFAGVYVLLRGEDRGIVARAAGEEAAAGLAVMPFSTSGVDPEVFREGMATLLATTLDGAAGIRAVDSRTVLARWRERVEDGLDPEIRTVLGVGRAAGARYALVGSAVAAGPDVALVAELMEVETGRELGTMRAQGPPDSLMALVDALSVDATRALLAAGGVAGPPLQHLSSLTTSSLPALLAYLRGENHYRSGEFEAALGAYEEAVTADSTFALASLRAEQAYGWNDQFSPARVAHRERARRMADRLPVRERMLLDGLEAVAAGDPAALPALEDAVRRFPDDPDLWNVLGEFYTHSGAKALLGPGKEEEALRRAHELQPEFAPYLIHLVEHYLAYADSAVAADWVAREGELAPGAAFQVAHDRAFRLIHGDPASAAAVADTLARDPGVSGYVRRALRGPDRLVALDRLTSTQLERHPGAPPALVAATDARLALGQPSRVRPFLEDERSPVLPPITLFLHVLGHVDAEDLDPAIWVADPTGAAAFAALRRDWPAYERYLAAIDTAMERLVAQDSAPLAEAVRGFREVARGLAAMERGRHEEAVQRLGSAVVRAPADVTPLLLFWLAEAHEARGDARAALAHYRAATQQGFQSTEALLRAARLHERFGETEEALQAYRGVLVAYAEADPELQPAVEEAREAVVRLSGPG